VWRGQSLVLRVSAAVRSGAMARPAGLEGVSVAAQGRGQIPSKLTTGFRFRMSGVDAYSAAGRSALATMPAAISRSLRFSRCEARTKTWKASSEFLPPVAMTMPTA
jgi:hypothetical protein